MGRIPQFASAFGSPSGNSFGQFGNFGLSNQLNGMNGMMLNSTPRILDRDYREQMLGAIGDISGAFGGGMGGGSGSSSSSSGGSADGYKELSDSLLGQIGQQGASRTEKINQAFDSSLDSSIASLYDRGWGNSSAIEGERGANMRNRQSSLTELGDSLLSQKIGVGSQIGLAGLNAANQRNNMQSQFQYGLLGNLFSGLFG